MSVSSIIGFQWTINHAKWKLNDILIYNWKNKKNPRIKFEISIYFKFNNTIEMYHSNMRFIEKWFGIMVMNIRLFKFNMIYLD